MTSKTFLAFRKKYPGNPRRIKVTNPAGSGFSKNRQKIVKILRFVPNHLWYVSDRIIRTTIVFWAASVVYKKKFFCQQMANIRDLVSGMKKGLIHRQRQELKNE
jgi:hypothetical protein